MSRVILIILCGILTFSCYRNAARHENNIPESTASTATPYPFDGSVFQKLDERFPKPMREVFEKAAKVQVLEVGECLYGNGRSQPKQKDQFQGCSVLRQASVTEPELRKQLVEEVEFAIGSHHSGMACFGPRHGIRAESNGKRVELLICFECENFRGASSMGSFGGGISPAVEKLFVRILEGKNE